MLNELSDSAKILFISDVHLGGFSPEKNMRVETELLELINYAEKNNFQIAVLGDLFDYWMEYENAVPQIGKKLLKTFSAFNQNNSSLYITGNHDNWTQGYFSEHGFDVERDYRLITISSKKVLLLHGDAVGDDLENLKRPLLHRIMRNKTFVKLFKTFLIRPKIGIRVMKYYSRFTGYFSKTDPKQLDNWSKSMLQSKNIDLIIAGHDHIPRVHTYSHGTYLNTGTFYDHKTLVTYNNKQFRLVYWNSKEQQLTPFTSSKAKA